MENSDLTGKVLMLLTRTKVPEKWRRDGAQALRSVFEDAGYRTELVFCDDPEAMIAQIKTNTTPGDIIAIGGGDGTINAVIDPIRHSGTVLLALPLGTANDFARSLKLPDDPIQAAQAAINGQLAQLDIGRVNGKSFVNAASIGVPADARKRINPDLKRWTGAISYAVANWQSWHDMPPLELDVTCAGHEKQHLKLRQLTVTNGQYFGGGLRPSENKRLDDGKLHVFAIRADVDTLSGMDIGAALLFGSVDESELALTMECDDIHIDCPEPHPILADGEIISKLPATFSLDCGALTVFAPNAFTGDALSENDIADGDALNDITIDTEDLTIRLEAIYNIASSTQLKAICHDQSRKLRDIVRQLELDLRPYGLPLSSPDPDFHSLETLRDKALSWVLNDLDERLAAGLLNQINLLMATLKTCPTEDKPEQIKNSLRALSETLKTLRTELASLTGD
ncbi:diacylglycerol kinase family protein [Thalassospira sp. TSL5-1]|uniref:diacylglycerol/lipid kinase family protein n=1 Tax=Thalassospira sp. TSL5-1 TaxID=1544451 RepID=UPI00093DFFF0|nr:diacylglycerol kinase family protein [Thalassospira sp. TSL5-1]OKH88870.1 lipid kinase [Thalassospira sp. TSL5-1]